jgi:hypothetical protein
MGSLTYGGVAKNWRGGFRHAHFPKNKKIVFECALRGFRLVIADAFGFPCCVPFACVHAVVPTPARWLGVLSKPYQPSPKALSGQPAQRSFRRGRRARHYVPRSAHRGRLAISMDRRLLCEGPPECPHCLGRHQSSPWASTMWTAGTSRPGHRRLRDRDILDRVLAKLRRRGLRGVKLVSDAPKASRPVIEGADRQLATLPRPLHALSARPCRRERAAPCLRPHRHRLAHDAGAARLQWRKVADQLRPSIPKLARPMNEVESVCWLSNSASD